LQLPDAVERTLLKFLRDFAVNLIAVAPFVYVDGALDVRMLLPAVGLAFHRTFRDVFPAAWKWINSRADDTPVA
jgi:hypothetical protein